MVMFKYRLKQFAIYFIATAIAYKLLSLVLSGEALLEEWLKTLIFAFIMSLIFVSLEAYRDQMKFLSSDEANEMRDTLKDMGYKLIVSKDGKELYSKRIRLISWDEVLLEHGRHQWMLHFSNYFKKRLRKSGDHE